VWETPEGLGAGLRFTSGGDGDVAQRPHSLSLLSEAGRVKGYFFINDRRLFLQTHGISSQAT